ncbi:hypothetical protein ACLOJK_015870 [Asimina triloba]
MAPEKTVLSMLFLLAHALSSCAVFGNAADDRVPAIFVFGDSLFDVGNNNFLEGTMARVDRPFNGIDFPGGVATGRFSNGYNIIDCLATLMGFEMSPEAFLSLVNTSTLHDKMSKGVNFASGGSGIQDSTGAAIGGAFSLKTQIENFATVRSNLSKQIGSEKTDDLLSKSLFVFSAGNCDILELDIWNISLANSTTNQQIVADLTTQFKLHLQKLHQLGARKFAILGGAAVGCTPRERSYNGGKCYEDMNKLVYSFHGATAAMLDQLKRELDGMSYSLGNMYEMMIRLLNNQPKYGFKDVVSGCCGSGPLNGGFLCGPNNTNHCSNRDEYLFWDPYHPTQKAANLIAHASFNGSIDIVEPINFQQLANEGT